jgi:hypothetical protein
MSVTGTAGGRIAPGVGANLIGQHAHDRNQEATVYVGNLDPQVGAARLRSGGRRGSGCRRAAAPPLPPLPALGAVRDRLRAALQRGPHAPHRVPQVTEELVWELFTQAGPVGEHLGGGCRRRSPGCAQHGAQRCTAGAGPS